MNDATLDVRGTPNRWIRVTLPVALAIALQLVVGFFTITAIGLVGVPVWGIVALVVLWAAGAAVIAVLASRTPIVTPVVPVVGGLLLWLIVTAGETWFGWVA